MGSASRRWRRQWRHEGATAPPHQATPARGPGGHRRQQQRVAGRVAQEEPRRAAVAEEAAGDGRISLAVARVSGEVEQAPQAGRRSRYSGRLRKELEWSRRRWPEVAGDRPAPGGGGGIAWAGAGASEKKAEKKIRRRSGARAGVSWPSGPTGPKRLRPA
jgi:hypothetical protein